MHVQAAVVQGQLAAEGDLRQFLFVQGLARLLEQGFQQAAFGDGEGEFLFVDADHAAHRAETQVAQFQLAGHRCRVAAAQDGAQAGGQLSRVAGFGQVIVGAKFQAENTVQGLAPGREHQHRQIRVIAAQLLEQFQAAAIGQHHIQYHGRRSGFGQRTARALAVVTGSYLKPFLAQPTAQELTQLLVIINQ
ncbi:hypothetical protein D3C78_1216990 [compost metagenome]